MLEALNLLIDAVHQLDGIVGYNGRLALSFAGSMSFGLVALAMVRVMIRDIKEILD